MNDYVAIRGMMDNIGGKISIRIAKREKLSSKVLRGGSWWFDKDQCFRSTDHSIVGYPGVGRHNDGFRIARRSAL